jgi:hypothetical protein
MMLCFGKAIDIMRMIFTYVAEKEEKIIGTSFTKFGNSLLDFIGSSATQYNRITRVIDMYTSVVKDASCYHDSRFRTAVLDLHTECVGDKYFRDYINNSSNKDFGITWKAFCENVYKTCKTYGAVDRLEPVAFVFEGGAGSGKTTLMNSYTSYLASKDMSTYVHTVPAAESSKDFYDDYNNEDVFVMDDVGQQSVSQWRTMINFVSTTKFPLDCAKAELKNTKSFNSKLILATTNHFATLNSFTKSDCISEPSALFRRPHLIDVKSYKDSNGYFYQILQYRKFDFRSNNPKWVDGFIDHCIESPVNPRFDSSKYPPGKRDVACLKWLSLVVEHVTKCTENDNKRCRVDKTKVEAIDGFDLETYYDARDFHSQFGDIGNTVSYYICDPVNQYSRVWKEWTGYYTTLFKDLGEQLISWCTERVIAFISTGKTCVDYIKDNLSAPGTIVGDILQWLSGDFGLGLIITTSIVVSVLLGYFVGDVFESHEDPFDVLAKACEAAKEAAKNDSWHLQSGNAINYFDETDRLKSVKKFMRLAVYRDDDPDRDGFTQSIVSGNKILVPAHAWPVEARIDIYVTQDHYRNNCKEREDVKVKLVRMYPGCDLAVYELTHMVARYPNCNNLFLTAAVANPRLYLVNTYATIPLLLGVSCINNTDRVSYGNYVHLPNTGYVTPLTAGGACGTMLFSEEHGIIGFHVAGNGSAGFCVVPPRCVADEIRALMLYKEDVPFRFDEEIRPDTSGARLRYPDEYVKVSRAVDETSLTPTIFHIDSNEHVKALKNAILDDVITPVKYDEIRDKAPPNFKCMGSPATLLKKTAKKTFKIQGRITTDENAFIKKCISTLIPEFDDIDDNACAFGNTELPALNKDSSNGYGCIPGKQNYFDFENKIIKQEAIDLFADFKTQVLNENVDIRKVLSTECFKDELRTVDKVDSPRTFRIMPLQHIWWTKKIFGNVMTHFKTNRMKTGICVGYNPYTDTDELAKKLKECKVTGDIDFSKWDGSIMAQFMHLIGECFYEKYKGKNKKMLEYIIDSMATSCVLVNDELYATTHGLPSGTWLTLLMNCLINKCLTALTLYSFDDDPTIKKFERVVDFVMGDDKVIGAGPDDASWFNLTTIDAVASDLGMVCTNGDKTPITRQHQPFDALTFVKRHFRYHPVLKRFMGCLSVETLLGTIQWMDKTKNIEEVLPGKIRAVQVEAYIHSPALFARFTELFDTYRPYDTISEKKVLDILAKDDSYLHVLRDLGKDVSYLE